MDACAAAAWEHGDSDCVGTACRLVPLQQARVACPGASLALLRPDWWRGCLESPAATVKVRTKAMKVFLCLARNERCLEKRGTVSLARADLVLCYLFLVLAGSSLVAWEGLPEEDEKEEARGNPSGKKQMWTSLQESRGEEWEPQQGSQHQDCHA